MDKISDACKYDLTYWSFVLASRLLVVAVSILTKSTGFLATLTSSNNRRANNPLPFKFVFLLISIIFIFCWFFGFVCAFSTSDIWLLFRIKFFLLTWETSQCNNQVPGLWVQILACHLLISMLPYLSFSFLIQCLFHTVTWRLYEIMYVKHQ